VQLHKVEIGVDEQHHEQLASIAHLYYERDLTQNDIAEQLGISRVKVYRMLKEARALGVIQISIDYPIKRDTALENQLCQRFGLKEALVLRTTRETERTAVRIGKLCARYLEALLDGEKTLAVCLGRTTYEVLQAIRPDFQATLRVIQAQGSIPAFFQDAESVALARVLTSKINGAIEYLMSPLVADTTAAAGVLRSQREIQRTLNAARMADVALVGIGNLDPSHSKYVQAGFISPAELQVIAQSGAVGDLAGQLFALDGSPHSSDFNERVIAISLDELRCIPTTIAAAYGAEKTLAIIGALRTGAVHVLCTDDLTARAVLHHA
jgi:deoxyribonucleoside regulator